MLGCGEHLTHGDAHACLQDASDAMGFLHSKRILHRDRREGGAARRRPPGRAAGAAVL
eukprot:gene3476-2294_t